MMTTRIREVIVSNKAQCNECGDIIESKNRHDFVTCSCKSLSVDGGKSYRKRCFKSFSNWTELSEFYEESYESDW